MACFLKSTVLALRTHVESLAFKHLSQEVSQVRVDGVTDAFLELMEQNVTHLPPGSAAAWRQVLNYAGSAFSFVHDSHLSQFFILMDSVAYRH